MHCINSFGFVNIILAIFLELQVSCPEAMSAVIFGSCLPQSSAAAAVGSVISHKDAAAAAAATATSLPSVLLHKNSESEGHLHPDCYPGK
jgi:hypothetical protein